MPVPSAYEERRFEDCEREADTCDWSELSSEPDFMAEPSFFRSIRPNVARELEAENQRGLYLNPERLAVGSWSRNENFARLPSANLQ